VPDGAALVDAHQSESDKIYTEQINYHICSHNVPYQILSHVS
jgi:hypothetical protein